MSNKKLIVGLVWKYPLTFCRGLRINFILHRYLILCFYRLTHLQIMEMYWYFSSLRKPLSWCAAKCSVLTVCFCFISCPVYKMLAYIRCWVYSETQHRKKANFWLIWEKPSFSCFKDPGRLMNSVPTHLYLPQLLEMKCEKWANLQLWAVSS